MLMIRGVMMIIRIYKNNNIILQINRILKQKRKNKKLCNQVQLIEKLKLKSKY